MSVSYQRRHLSLKELNSLQLEVEKSQLQQLILNALWASIALIPKESDLKIDALSEIGLVLGLNDDGGYWYYVEKIRGNAKHSRFE